METVNLAAPVFLVFTVINMASLIGSDYYQPEPEPGSGPEEYYQVVTFQAKSTLPGRFRVALNGEC